jgi:hypothetical protein
MQNRRCPGLLLDVTSGRGYITHLKKGTKIPQVVPGSDTSQGGGYIGTSRTRMRWFHAHSLQNPCIGNISSFPSFEKYRLIRPPKFIFNTFSSFMWSVKHQKWRNFSHVLSLPSHADCVSLLGLTVFKVNTVQSFRGSGTNFAYQRQRYPSRMPAIVANTSEASIYSLNQVWIIV